MAARAVEVAVAKAAGWVATRAAGTGAVALAAAMVACTAAAREAARVLEQHRRARSNSGT
jgi:hypothetical protein